MSMTKKDVFDVFRFYASKEFEDIPLDEDEIEHEFSERFHKKMEKLFIKLDYDSCHNFSKIERNILVLIAAILTLFAGLMSVGAVREPIVEFLIETFDGFEEISFKGETIDKIKYVYSFSIVPEGFIQTNCIPNETIHVVQYKNEQNGHIIELRQVATKEHSFYLDNEHGKIQEYIVNNMEVNVYISEYGDYYYIYWINETYSMNLTYSGKTSLEEVLKLIYLIS